jgi:four helix bundle protein
MAFAVVILRMIDRFPLTAGGHTVSGQVARSATSIGANYRACCNARSRAEFIAKLGIVVEEAEESAYWLEVAVHARLLPEEALIAARLEALELRAIFAKSLGTARTNLKHRNAQVTKCSNNQMPK